MNVIKFTFLESWHLSQLGNTTAVKSDELMCLKMPQKWRFAQETTRLEEKSISIAEFSLNDLHSHTDSAVWAHLVVKGNRGAPSGVCYTGTRVARIRQSLTEVGPALVRTGTCVWPSYHQQINPKQSVTNVKCLRRVRLHIIYSSSWRTFV